MYPRQVFQISLRPIFQLNITAQESHAIVQAHQLAIARICAASTQRAQIFRVAALANERNPREIVPGIESSHLTSRFICSLFRQYPLNSVSNVRCNLQKKLVGLRRREQFKLI